MSSKHQALGPVMLDLEGFALQKHEISWLRSQWVGGVILFTRNFQDLEQLDTLVKEIREVRSDILIAVDHEGGRVQRFRNGFSRIPPMASLGRLYCEDPEQAIYAAKELGWLLAIELTSRDIDFSFAPVLDLDYGCSAVIGDRAFSSEPAVAVALARSLVAGMREAGMSATGKHFPGHGAVAADSHIEIPVDKRSLSEVMRADGQVFDLLIQDEIEALMPAHVIYPEVDSAPAGFSPIWMQGILRETLGFEGVIFSDDLGMEGASVAGGFAERARAALAAGCDMILICNEPKGIAEVLDYLEQAKPLLDPKSGMRLSRMKHRQDIMSVEELQASGRWQDAQKLLDL